MDKTKSYEISKHAVLEAFKKVKANKGAAGIDDESLEAFEANLRVSPRKIGIRRSSCHPAAMLEVQLGAGI